MRKIWVGEGKRGGGRERVLCWWYLSHQTPLALQVLCVQLPLLASGAGHGLVAPSSCRVGRGTVPWSLSFFFPKTSSHNWQFKNMMMVNSQSSCWPWEVWEVPCSWATLLYQGKACYPHFCTSTCCPGAEVGGRVPFLKEESFAGYSPKK